MTLPPQLRALATLALTVCLAAVCAAQQGSTEPKPNQQEYTFTTGTELVLVPVVVRDRDGAHVPGLTAKDFVVQQDGKDQAIATLEEVTAAVRPARKRRLPPGVFTNLTNAEQAPRNVTLVLLDMLNTTPESHAQNREQLLRGLARSINPRTPTALLILNEGGVRLVHDFTSSPSVLLAAINRVVYRREDTAGTQKETVSESENVDPNALNSGGTGIPAGGGGSLARLDQMVNDINAYMEGIAAPIATYKRGAAIASTLEALRYIAGAYAGIQGRKALIWVSSGFPFEALDESGRVGSGSVHSAYQEALRALTDANIALYPVDIRGLTNVGFGATPTRVARRAADEAPILDAEYAQNMARISNLENLAHTTGGRAFYNTNNIGEAFESASQDSAAYYLLGYYLKRDEVTPGWHKLKVRVPERKVDIRARQGFFVRDGQPDSQDDRNTDILAALRSPVDSTQLPVVFHWNHVERVAEGRKAVFGIELPAGSVQADHGDNLKIDFVVVATTPAGEPVKDFAQTYTAKLSEEGLRRIAENGVTYSNAIVVPPGRYNVRVVVRDSVSGRTGSVAAPLIAE